MALLHRRPNPPRHSSYQRYKAYLREDFAYTCVYCGIHENEAGGPRYFSVEHYRPKSRFPALTTSYPNLLYACGVCNSYKGDDWPSDDPLTDGEGYLDPCEHDFDQHFEPGRDFRVAGKTTVADYMIRRMHLNRSMMRKIRRNRQEEAELHQQFVALVERNLNLLSAALGNAALLPQQQSELQQELDTLQAQLQRRTAAWNERWEPMFSMDDYR
ncbi:MAG: HNH endonuclease [Chloroflexaceae bacterium]|jgi:hypothetical protein|nr:HNH endonuclease [Chloroflexaceae bacterium]